MTLTDVITLADQVFRCRAQRAWRLTRVSYKYFKYVIDGKLVMVLPSLFGKIHGSGMMTTFGLIPR